jgi:hypothetical protein
VAGCPHHQRPTSPRSAGTAEDSQAAQDHWGELHLRSATPDAGGDRTDDGTQRERRRLKHRAEGDIRIVPVHPELTTILRDHLDRFGTGPDGRLFSGVRSGELPITSWPGAASARPRERANLGTYWAQRPASGHRWPHIAAHERLMPRSRHAAVLAGQRGTTRTFKRWAGGARTHDRRIMSPQTQRSPKRHLTRADVGISDLDDRHLGTYLA